MQSAEQFPEQRTGPSAEPYASAPLPESTSNGVPRWSRAQERFTQAVALAAWLYGVYWLYWRWTQTFNPDYPIFSTTLLVAETYGIISAGLLLFTVWSTRHRFVPPARPGLSVDVFITCYNEPLQLIRRTALGARDIRYPHKTYILDDGKRNEVRAMARELGIGYIRRKGNEHAKAGNLNNALKHTRGEFILQLDADHVPLPQILDRLLGHFEDERLAFVQSPQDFYNTSDSFTHVVNDEGRRLWEENRIFFSLIQPGKDCWNAAFFCGSCGMLRRKALLDIGGFSTLTITEDMETSIVLHARGWRSAYHGETLAYGLAPASAGQYHVQRLRWGQGSMQILRKMNPLFVRGLDWKQKLLYFASVLTYFDGLQKLIFYAAPILFFFTGAIPVSTTDRELLMRLIPYIGLTVISFELLSRGTGWIFISERYNMTKFWTYILALSALFTRKPLKFQVTPKGEGDVPWRTYAPQIVIATLSALAIPFAVAAHRFGWVTYRVSGIASAAFAFNGLWVLWNLYFAAYVIRHSIASRQQRADYRFIDALPIEIRRLDGDASAVAAFGTTQDLNANGLAFRSIERFAVGDRLEIPLILSTGLVTVRGVVMRASHATSRFGEISSTGIRFDDDLPMATRDAIELHCAHHAVPLWQRRYRQSVHMLSHLSERFRDLRIGARRPVHLPVRVRLASAETLSPATPAVSATLEEVSRTGARLVMCEAVEPGTTLQYEVPGSGISGEGRVVFARAVGSERQLHYIVGLQSTRGQPSWWSRVRRLSAPVMMPAPPCPPPLPAAEPAVAHDSAA